MATLLSLFDVTESRFEELGELQKPLLDEFIETDDESTEHSVRNKLIGNCNNAHEVALTFTVLGMMLNHNKTENEIESILTALVQSNDSPE